MIFAVAMTFIDQTIVSIAVPNIQRELALSSTGVQWVVNGWRRRSADGETTGITQTIRNFGASLGLAVLGTVLLTVQRSQLTASLQAQHVPNAAQVAARVEVAG
jgi:hypothetical protein